MNSSKEAHSSSRQRRPDRAVYVPRGRRGQYNVLTVSPSSSELKTENAFKIEDDLPKESRRIVSPSRTLNDAKIMNRDENCVAVQTKALSPSTSIDRSTSNENDQQTSTKHTSNSTSPVKQTPHTSTSNAIKHTTISKKDDSTASDDDWESMFDDDGECLDAKIVDEISAAVNKVSLKKSKSNSRTNGEDDAKEPINLEGEEFPHVLEVSNFPVEFKTPDLMMIFIDYKESGFDIKWVDDTHALVVFSTSKIAAQALSIGHPFVKLKPLTRATNESRAKAKKGALTLQPYRQRPETCAALARRLVTGALGVRLSTAREELENERRVLREARERKLLAAKQKDEAWEN